MNVRLEKITTALLGVLAAAGIGGRAQTDADGEARSIKAVQEDEKTIRVIVPGQFETTFTKQKGFGGVWFDLKHDPQRKHDLAPVLDENGFLWAKNGPPGADGSWYANPPREMTLLESGPTRVRIRLSGAHQRYGMTKPEAAWNELGFEQTFTVYPSGAFYVDYALIAQQPSPLNSITSCSFSSRTAPGEIAAKAKARGRSVVRVSSGRTNPMARPRPRLRWNGPTAPPGFRISYS
jgi:hypothetical protein